MNLKAFFILVFLSAPLQGMHALRSLPHTLTATRTRQALCALALMYAVHEGYRYRCHSAHTFKAAITKQATRLDNQRETIIITLHGLADNKQFFNKYEHAHGGFIPTGTKIEHCGFNDALSANIQEVIARAKNDGAIPWSDLIALRDTDIGQETDMQQFENLLKVYADKNIILVGVSRGATLALNYVALRKPGNIVGIIAETPFDDLQNVMREQLRKLYLHWIPGLPGIANLICAGLFKHYSTYGIAARDVIASIPHDIPVLFVCSQEDSIIPAANTRALYDALQKAGHQKCQLMQTEHGKHAKILTGEDGEQYKKAAAEFVHKLTQPH